MDRGAGGNSQPEHEVAIMIRYWLPLLGALCATIAVAYLPPPERTDTAYQTHVIRSDSVLLRTDDEEVWNAYVHYTLAAHRLRYGRMYARTLERGDSILQEVESQAVLEGRYQLTSGPDVPPALLDVIESQLAYVSTGARTSNHEHPGTVAVFLDTVGDHAEERSIRFHMPRFVYLLPQKPGQPCISLVTLGKAAATEVANGRLRPGRILGQSPPALLGPCAFYSQFGMPGGEIDSWLQQQELRAALLPNWLAPTPFPDWASRGLRLAGRPGYSRSDYPALVSCASGDRQACLRALTLRPSMPLSVLDAGRPHRVVIGWEREWYWRWSFPLGPRSRSFLSDMVLALGEDRFQRFWSSDEQVETAFSSAAGVSLADWTMDWARQQIGVPPRGPSAPPASAALSLVVAIAFAGAGVVYAARREVR
ncbi:MAG: hypothetical protein JSW71_03065 [Gemmatimonadota bacterium]|nr:MAG: hypothetical protein JSW71_03065 [Gemmatimonadota bacterium]